MHEEGLGGKAKRERGKVNEKQKEKYPYLLY